MAWKNRGAGHLLAAALLCAPAAAGAQDGASQGSSSPAYKACMDKSGGVTVAMLDCGNAEYVRLDAALNAAYRAATNGLEPAQRHLLRDAQRAWLGYRDSSCSFMSRLGDRGTMAALTDQSCLMQVTAERTRWLKDLAPL
ncbi:lysozyme inhibitor LprI family protein [Bosea sp. NPDC055594]